MMMDFDLLILVAVALVVAAVASLVAIKAWRHHSDERRIRKHLGK
jgi:Flp pilus assembly protein CpaB